MEKFTLKEIPLPANLTAADLSSSSRKVKLKRVRLLEEQAAESARIGDAPSENYPTKPELPMRKDAQKDSVQDQNEIESIGDTIKRRIKSELKAAASSPNSTEEGDKARSDIVDEMFRDFLAQKMELVEKEYVKKRKLDTSKNEQNQKESSSVDDNQEPDDKDERDEKVKKKHKKKKHKHEKHKKRDKHEKSKHAKRSKRSRSRSKSTEEKEDSMSKDLESSVPLSKEESLSTRSTQSVKQDPKFSPRKEDSKSMSPPRKKHSKRRRSRSKSPERKEDSLSKDLKPRAPLSKEESLSTRSTQKIEVDSKSMSPPRRKHSKRSRSRSESHERKEDSMSKDLKPRAPLSKEESLSTRSAQGVEKDSKFKATSHRKHSKRSKSGSKSPERKEDSMSKVLKSSVALSKEESLSTRSTPSIVEDSKFSSRSRKSKSKSPPRRKKDSKSISPLKFEEDATEIKSVSPPAPKLISKFRLSHDKVDDIESKLQHMKGDPVRSWPFSHKKESSPDTNKIIDKPFSKSKANEQNETDTQNSSNLKATASNSDSDKRLTVKQNKPPDSNSEVRVHVVTSALQRLTDADVCHSTPSTSTIPPTSIPLPVEPPTTKGPSVATVTSGNKAMPLGLLTKKPGIALKISSASANLISSGEVVPPPNKKKKLLEEGEVTSSDTDESSDDSDTGEDDDDVSKLNDDGFPSETGSITDSDDDKSGKAKKKKKKKHKHKGLKRKKKKKKNKKKSSNSRSRSVSPMGPRSPSPSRRRDRSTSRGRNRDRSTSRDRHRDRSDSRERYRDRSRSRDRFREEPSIRVEKQWIAEKGKPLKLFTRTYRETHGMDDRKRSRSRSPDRDRSRGKERDKRSPDSRRNRSRERGQRRDSSRDRDKGGKGREKDRKDREKDLQIDKAKLRKIAIANAVHIMKSRGGSQAAISSDALAKLRAGGKSVEELTDYCKKLSDRDKQRQLERSLRADDSLSDSSEDYEQAAKSEEEDFTIHHPFAVKEAPNIVMNIRNMKQLPILTPQEKVTEGAKLRLTFPVSSGSQHRAKESEWVPVEKSTAPPAVTTTVNTTAVSTPSPIPPDASSRSAPVAPATITTAADVAKEVATVAVPEKDKVFPDPPKMPIDIGSIVSERLAAVRRLQANPNDVQAISQMRTAQKKASLWAESKVLPGQFMGSTGATIMSQHELIGPDKKRQAWARKEQLSTAAPLAGGIGMMMLQKLGWKHGEGLGKNSDGPQTPLMLDVKIDRKGLTSQDEVQRKVPAPRAQRTTVKDLSGKHPVSALVEVCNKRKWGTPDFILVEESGPPHKKNFIFKVAVNGVEYQSAVASNNKKQAKAQAATGCLQELGLVPR